MYRKDRKKEFYTEKAREEGYPARSVYKLKEMDEKHELFKKNDKVLDLGCAPGSWLLYISEKIGPKGKIVGIDVSDLKIPLKKNMVFIKGDIMQIKKSNFPALNLKYQSVVSDLAPSTSGIKFVDNAKSLELSEKALKVAQAVLLPRGNFVCKIFEGDLTDSFFRRVEANFKVAKRFKPRAVFKKSKEIYIIAKGFKKR